MRKTLTVHCAEHERGEGRVEPMTWKKAVCITQHPSSSGGVANKRATNFNLKSVSRLHIVEIYHICLTSNVRCPMSDV